MLVGGDDAAEHLDAAGRFRRKEFQHGAAQFKGLFHFGRGADPGAESEVAADGFFHHGGVEAGGHGKLGTGGKGTVQVMHIQHSTGADQQIRELVGHFFDHFRSGLGTERDFCTLQPDTVEDFADFHTVFHRIQCQHRNNADRTQRISSLLLQFLKTTHDIPPYSLISRNLIDFKSFLSTS